MTVGPYFDQVHTGQVFTGAPSMTLTPGVAAVHQSILGDRLRLPLDSELSAVVTGLPGTLAHPGLVCDVAIGQSTLATQHVKANLFYRGLTFFRFPAIGDTLFTQHLYLAMSDDEIGALNVPDWQKTILTAMARYGMFVGDTGGSPWGVEFESGSTYTSYGQADPWVAWAKQQPGETDWNGDAFRQRVTGPHFDPGLAGSVLHSGADVVSSAPELARLTLNIAGVHHDSRLGGRRLVYGGHTIGLALAQAGKLLPNIATVLGWQSCDHIAPVYEGDTLYSELHIESAEQTDHGGVLGLRSLVYAFTDDPDEPRQVLDWRFTALQF